MDTPPVIGRRRLLVAGSALVGAGLLRNLADGGIGPAIDDFFLKSVKSNARQMVAFWHQNSDNPPNRLGPPTDIDTHGYSFEKQFGLAAQHGLRLARFDQLVDEIAAAPTTEDKFQVIRQFWSSNFGMNLVNTGPPLEHHNIESLAQASRALCNFPLELFEALSDRNLGTFYLTTDPSASCNLPQVAGCTANGGKDLYVGIPGAGRNNEYTFGRFDTGFAGVVMHELGHRVEKLLLPNIAMLLAAYNPEGFRTVSYETYLQQRDYNPFPTAVASPYGMVDSEGVSTLFEAVAYADPYMFQGFNAYELDPQTASVRVMKLALLISSLDKVVQSSAFPKQCDLAGYLSQMFVGHQMLDYSHSSQNVSVNACCSVAEEVVNSLASPRNADDTRVLTGSGTQVLMRLHRGGKLSANPDGVDLFTYVEGAPLPLVKVIGSSDSFSYLGRNGVSWKVGQEPSQLGLLVEDGKYLEPHQIDVRVFGTTLTATAGDIAPVKGHAFGD